MADAYTQAGRLLRVTTPLGTDALLITGFAGTEGLSQLYTFTLDLRAPGGDPIDFATVLGQPAAVELDTHEGGTRYFHGVVSRFAQGPRDEEFIVYRAELVPAVWFLTRRERSRIFQHLSVPEILKQVLAGFDVDYPIQGQFEPRDYCAQYRESDWAFASRLMEEEGIYYYFTHAADGAMLVLANTPQGHPAVPEPAKLIYEEVVGGNRPEGRVWSWEKVQEVVSGKVTLWDHCFELPGQNLEAASTIPKSVAAGTVEHDLTAGRADSLEVYDHPGGHAGRFDGVDPGGSDQPAEVQKIFDDGRRTARIRLQESAAGAVRVDGTSDCGQLTAGHTFTLSRHFDADGDYVLTRVEHEAVSDDYRSAAPAVRYSNRFQCLPLALPFRPPRTTPRPTVMGSQTATVVGPGGEEIFTDKYGRIKVQFHWDREGKNDADSSCWVRVGTVWAGQNWGAIHIPRIGQEVIVDFLEGDPDQPIVVGSVYNADQMPPWKLPANRTQSGILSRSSPGGSAANANVLRFEDKKGSEQVWLHAEKNQDIEVENDETHSVGHDRVKTISHDEITHVKHDRTETVDNDEKISIGNDRAEEVGKNEKITIGVNRTESVGKDESIAIGGKRTESVDKDESIAIGGSRKESVGKDESIDIGGGRKESVGKDESISIGGSRKESVGKDEKITVGGGRTVTVGKSDALDVGKTLSVTAADSITLTVGSASITMKKDGTITINGKDITINGSGEVVAKASKDVTIKGKKIHQN